MPLDEYQRKRDFAATPEPPGAEAATGSGRFVVQRHRATRLHYDLRLEIDGVLVSWAVPKGPTLDPRQRRMAVHVEDHPIEYFDFEGTIPRGEYGGGDVIVWDWGGFEPEGTDDPGSAVRAGELKFRLNGEKLRGRFTLVRTGGRRGASSDEKDQWLIIHKRDEDAVAGWDPEDHPRSVKTGRTNDEVKEGAPAVWSNSAPAAEAEIDLSAAREEPMPDFVSPMLATPVQDAFSDPAWLYEVKWDGYRVQAVVRGGRVRLWTRGRKDAAAYFPDLAAAPEWIAAREAIVDGEVVALDSEGKPDFSLLQDRTGIRGAPGAPRGSDRPRPGPDQLAAIPLAYQLFDLLYLDGRSLLDVPLEHRKRLLRSVLLEHPTVRYAGHVAEDGEAFVEAARERGLEGVVAKQRASRYETGRRSRSWLKIKLRREQELVVAGWLPGRGSHRELGSLIVGVYDDGQLRHAGQVGSGLDARTRRELRSRLDELARRSSPLEPVPKLKDARWVEPQIVIRAEFAEWTTDNLLRQAAFKGIEIDRDPGEVHREEVVPTQNMTAPAAPTEPRPAEPRPAELRALSGLKAGGSWSIAGHELRLTNLDKVLFPEADGHRAITKRDLIRYYVSIAPVLLPYLRGRGVNLHRFPDGIASRKGFWQKDIPKHAPQWVHDTGWEYTGHEGTKRYVVVDRPATLGWLAQEAAIELHPWTSPTRAPDRPSYALIDIDPGESTTWDEVLTLARLYRTALQHLGVIGLPKVSGKRGIQVWVPIKPIYGFDATRDWVEHLSRAVGQTVPDLVSWQWSKRARSGKARLDFTQNAVNRTLVAPYSVRPAAGGPVSAPISWEELEDPKLRPDRWTLRTIGRRLKARGDLFAPALETEQELPKL
jgi:bifunctional non-homologous end joining protein LigD